MSPQFPRVLLGLAGTLFTLGLACFVIEISLSPLAPHLPFGIFGGVFLALAFLLALGSLFVARSPVPLRGGEVLNFQVHPVRTRLWYILLALMGIGSLLVFLTLLVKQHGT